MRIIVYTGKGGVGKTSIAAATALKASQGGYRTLVMSTDPAHSLGDSFDVTLDSQPVSLSSNLWAQEVDVLQELDIHWKTVQQWLSALMRWQGADEVVAEELAVLPGMDELASLLYITRHNKSGDYDLLVVDAAPTAETLRLLSFPDMAKWYMHRLFPLERRVAAAVGPLVRGVLRLPVPGVKVFDSIQSLYNELEEMRELLQDRSTSSIRLVVNPEKMVIKEAQRTFTYLNLYGYHTDLIVCNRIIPEGVDGTFLANWRQAQEKYIELIHESFDPIPLFRAPLMEQEVTGLESLDRLATHVFKDEDPAQMFYTETVQEIIREGDRNCLVVKIPFTTKEDLSVIEKGDELTIQAGAYRRNIILPRMLAGAAIEEAKMEGDTLKICFEKTSKKSKK